MQRSRRHAGFTAASSILIASFEGARTSPVFATVIGMLLISFLIFGLVARRHTFS